MQENGVKTKFNGSIMLALLLPEPSTSTVHDYGATTTAQPDGAVKARQTLSACMDERARSNKVPRSRPSLTPASRVLQTPTPMPMTASTR